MFLTINSLQAMDRPIPATLLSLFRQGMFFIPLLFVLGRALGKQRADSAAQES